MVMVAEITELESRRNKIQTIKQVKCKNCLQEGHDLYDNLKKFLSNYAGA